MVLLSKDITITVLWVSKHTIKSRQRSCTFTCKATNASLKDSGFYLDGRAKPESAEEAGSETEAGGGDGRYVWTWETLEAGTCRRPNERERRNRAH